MSSGAGVSGGVTASSLLLKHYILGEASPAVTHVLELTERWF